jgi:hypothetical protein
MWFDRIREWLEDAPASARQTPDDGSRAREDEEADEPKPLLEALGAFVLAVAALIAAIRAHQDEKHGRNGGGPRRRTSSVRASRRPARPAGAGRSARVRVRAPSRDARRGSRDGASSRPEAAGAPGTDTGGTDASSAE